MTKLEGIPKFERKEEFKGEADVVDIQPTTKKETKAEMYERVVREAAKDVVRQQTEAASRASSKYRQILKNAGSTDPGVELAATKAGERAARETYKKGSRKPEIDEKSLKASAQDFANRPAEVINFGGPTSAEEAEQEAEKLYGSQEMPEPISDWANDLNWSDPDAISEAIDMVDAFLSVDEQKKLLKTVISKSQDGTIGPGFGDRALEKLNKILASQPRIRPKVINMGKPEPKSVAYTLEEPPKKSLWGRVRSWFGR